jgi:hypothetical protein
MLCSCYVRKCLESEGAGYLGSLFTGEAMYPLETTQMRSPKISGPGLVRKNESLS